VLSKRTLCPYQSHGTDHFSQENVLKRLYSRFKSKWEVVIRTLTKDDDYNAFQRWPELSEKGIHREDGGYRKKIRINVFCTVFFVAFILIIGRIRVNPHCPHPR
jgi:hypothetical protein